jgi:hypothetical protein
MDRMLGADPRSRSVHRLQCTQRSRTELGRPRPKRASLAPVVGRHAARLATALYLVVYLVAVAPLAGAAWVRGGHVTPEQWAYHQQLERLGVPHHHGSAGQAVAEQASPARASLETASALVSVSPSTAFRAAPPATALFFERLLELLIGVLPRLVLPEPVALPEAAVLTVSSQHWPRVPEKPPSRAA